MHNNLKLHPHPANELLGCRPQWTAPCLVQIEANLCLGPKPIADLVDAFNISLRHRKHCWTSLPVNHRWHLVHGFHGLGCNVPAHIGPPNLRHLKRIRPCPTETRFLEGMDTFALGCHNAHARDGGRCQRCVVTVRLCCSCTGDPNCLVPKN